MVHSLGILALVVASSLGAPGGSVLGQGVYLPQSIIPPPPITAGSGCLNERRPDRPTGRLVVVPGTGEVVGSGASLLTFGVEVEEGLGVDPDCFARVVEITLGDERSWIGSGRWSFQRVDTDDADLKISLAAPATVDARCLPLDTAGVFSCWDGSRAMINSWRWENGASDFSGMLGEYRSYVINHELGHGLGFGHVGCPQAGAPAPVMMQQTKTTGECEPNGWPNPGS